MNIYPITIKYDISAPPCLFKLEKDFRHFVKLFDIYRENKFSNYQSTLL